MEKKRLTRLFLCEVLLIGFCCYIAGATIGFSIYGFWYFHEPLHEMKHCGFLYGKSMLYTFLFFCLIETVCSFRLKHRIDRLQIRELMYEGKRSQGVKEIESYKKWGIVFLLCFVCLIGCVCGIVFFARSLCCLSHFCCGNTPAYICLCLLQMGVWLFICVQANEIRSNLSKRQAIYCGKCNIKYTNGCYR